MICNDSAHLLTRQPDGDGFYLHCTGGVRGSLGDDDRWQLEPIVHNGHPCRKGFCTRSELETFLKNTGLRSIAFHRFGWDGGNYFSSWYPVIPRRTNHLRGPSDLWGSMAANSAMRRYSVKLDNTPHASQRLSKIMDERTEEERLAQSISLSLRSMDISVEQICEFYHEQLVNLMAVGALEGRRFRSTLDQTLFAHVHSFFLHLGSARDYLASYIALRLGHSPHKIDSMQRLVGALSVRQADEDALLSLLKERKLIVLKAGDPNMLELAGWLAEGSRLRNDFVHRKPYGLTPVEQSGWLEPIRPHNGFFRYVRPIHSDGAETDILDLVAWHYRNTAGLFQDLAEISGLDISMLTLTKTDIVSLKRGHRK